MQALLDLIELPTRVLRRHCPGFHPKETQQARSGQAAEAAAARGTPPAAHPDPGSLARGGDPRLRRATKLAYRDLADLAMQEVLSNGCAPPTRETLDILRELHPRGTGAVGAPSSLSAAGDGLHAPGQGGALQAGGQAAPVRGLLRLERVPALPERGQQARGRCIPFFQ